MKKRVDRLFVFVRRVQLLAENKQYYKVHQNTDIKIHIQHTPRNFSIDVQIKSPQNKIKTPVDENF